MASIATAHYGVEGNGFYGIKIADVLPYSVTRTWHVQLGIFWIATAWLAAGLFIGPLVSGYEPKYQRLGVHALFGALLVVVAGSMTGEWLSVQNRLSDGNAFLWGHQGYEYVDLGRVWQILLFVGLLLWFVLVVRAIRPALKTKGEHKPLLWLFVVSAGAIGLFYGAGLTWGQHTHLSIVEYWRWWVVHLWVEGFFEVFASTVIAFFFMRLGLIRPALAAQTALLSATIFLSGGIIGTCHHRYFSGTPTVALAWGSVFSALEVVPLTMVAYAALDDLRRGRLTVWAQRYRWSLNFFVACGVLEYGGRRSIRLYDQSTDRSVLHAGAEHHAAPRPCGTVRRLWDARYRPDVGLSSRDGSGGGVEGELAAALVLGK